MTIERSHCPGNGRSTSSSEQSETYQRNKTFIYYCVFMIPIPIYKYISIYTLAPYLHDSWYLGMTITFESDSDVFIYPLEKIISFAGENTYLFIANCVWWIAAVIGLDTELIIYIDNLEARRRKSNYRPVSETPGDIARRVSPEKQPSEHTFDPLRKTGKGRINPLPQTKKQLRKARQAERRKKAKLRNLKQILD